MLKQRPVPQPKHKRGSHKIWLGLSFSLCLLTVMVWLFKTQQPEKSQQPSQVLPLVSLSPEQRDVRLKAIIQSNSPFWKKSEVTKSDRSRARYLLAVDLLKAQRAKAALIYLKDLERNYSVLAPQILVQQANAYQLLNQSAQVQQVYQQLITKYPDSLAIPEVLFWLSHTDVSYQQQLIEKFPYHPLTQKLVRQLLQQDSNQLHLLLLLAKYSREPNTEEIRDRLVLEYPAQLTPEDWEAIASGYWREEKYRKAADAYTLARLTPRNLYRAARGFHLNGNFSEAIRSYQRLIDEFHDSRETGLSLLHLASISGSAEAIAYLEMAIEKFPEQAPQALLSQGLIYDALKQSELANQARQKLLQQYPNSEAAVTYRWQEAQKLAVKGNIQGAYSWVQPLIKIKGNLNLEILPKAIFWAGKWAKQLGFVAESQQAFQKVITIYPQSYYAWRSAVKLGWQVGDFDDVRAFNPALEFPELNLVPYTNSDTIKELLVLGQYQSAWNLLESEIKQPQELTVSEQFIEGLLLLKLRQISAGINQVWDLAQRENPHEQQKWQALRKTPTYWYALFPFPYRDEILTNSQQSKINPLLVVAVMRKESTFAPEINSRVGAVGLMQVVPETAQWVAAQINLAEYSLKQPEDNIKIGTWYLAHNHERYQNNSLLAIASYNAGTGNVNQWLQQYNTQDLDSFVEDIPFPETKDYVEGVFSNYWNYLRLYDPQVKQQVANYLKRNK
ncbi:Lytic transglycosylase catalytic [Stanieria cyanosphaera PCC 7437]|uniref:Lytic transglycosylase catalytic n=1 Tax=Stanieria cyanosphaera (strain ATCC 29371 / PCC 7437) TaxID=111780 RepID=K9XRL5_STAC7|nr:transglycosylase SLT domain-containing protein [Stanieria cyanosphaera]AFZ34322.1 Lytic transglycosylase catalytic [Stanieria cyanosphaera PCC 7437]